MTISIQSINIGTTPEDGTGDTARDAFDKVNDNFTELSTAVGGAQYLFPDTNLIQIANAEDVGGNIVLYDTDHATRAGDIEFRVDTGVAAFYDASEAEWQFTNAAINNIDGGDISGSSFIASGGSTVAGLPSGIVGQILRVTDANSPSVGSTVTGGGAAAALVWYNGSNWTVIGV